MKIKDNVKTKNYVNNTKGIPGLRLFNAIWRKQFMADGFDFELEVFTKMLSLHAGSKLKINMRSNLNHKFYRGDYSKFIIPF